MNTLRRSFLRSGLAAAAFGAYAPRAAFSIDRNEPVTESAQIGWSQLPSILANIVPPTFPASTFDITDFGAEKGGFDCAPAIAAAIEYCNGAGGGQVIVPAGSWRCNGPIQLLSNVDLHLELGATINFGTNPSDYLPLQLVRWQGVRCYNYSPLIYSFGQTNIAVTGQGVLNGNGASTWGSWVKRSAPDWNRLLEMSMAGVPLKYRTFGEGHYLRPGFFEPYQCQNVLLQGVTLQGSPFWTIHPTFCNNVTIQDVTVLPGAENDDGCDPDSCQNVLVTGCSFTTGDDNVSLKAGLRPDADGLAPCRNIVIQNCDCVQSSWSGLTIGSDVGGTVSNVFIENCTVGHCENAHYIKGWAQLGGAVKDIYVRNTKVQTCHALLSIAPDEYPEAGKFKPPLISNINLESITCANVLDPPFIFSGDARRHINGVNLTDFKIHSPGHPPAGLITNTDNIRATNVLLNGKSVMLSD